MKKRNIIRLLRSCIGHRQESSFNELVQYYKNSRILNAPIKPRRWPNINPNNAEIFLYKP